MAIAYGIALVMFIELALESIILYSIAKYFVLLSYGVQPSLFSTGMVLMLGMIFFMNKYRKITSLLDREKQALKEE